MIKPVVVTLLLSLCVANSLIICGRNGGVPCPNGKRELQKQVKDAVDKPARPLAKLKKGTGVFLMKRKDLVEFKSHFERRKELQKKVIPLSLD